MNTTLGKKITKKPQEDDWFARSAWHFKLKSITVYSRGYLTLKLSNLIQCKVEASSKSDNFIAPHKVKSVCCCPKCSGAV